MNRKLIAFSALLTLISTVNIYARGKKRPLESPTTELRLITNTIDPDRVPSPTKTTAFKAILLAEKASSGLDPLITKLTSKPSDQDLFFNPIRPGDLSVVSLIGVDGSVDASTSLSELLQRKTHDAQKALERAKKEDKELQDWQLAREKGDYKTLYSSPQIEEERKRLVRAPSYYQDALEYVLKGRDLFRAIQENPEEVPGILGTGGDPGAYNHKGATALSASIQGGAPTTTQSLLDARLKEVARRSKKVFHADLPDRATGNSPLITATIQGNEPTVRALLDAGVAHCYQNADGDTATIIAARLGLHNILEALLERHTPAELRISNKKGKTALIEASTERGQEAIKRTLFLSRVSRSLFD